MDWLIQEAANDLLNADEDAVGEEHGGERREEGSVGEEEGPAFMDEDLPEEEEEEESNAGEGVGEEAGGALMEEPLPEEGGGEKQGRALGTVFGEVKPSADKGVGEGAATTLNGEGQGDARTEEEEEGGREGEVEKALMGEGELCLRLGLKAEGAVVGSASWLDLSTKPGVSKDGRKEERLPEGGLAMGALVGDPEPCWSASLELQSYGVVLLIFQVLKGARLPVVVGMSGGLWLVNVGRQSMDCANGERGSAGFDSGL